MCAKPLVLAMPPHAATIHAKRPPDAPALGLRVEGGGWRVEGGGWRLHLRGAGCRGGKVREGMWRITDARLGAARRQCQLSDKRV